MNRITMTAGAALVAGVLLVGCSQSAGKHASGAIGSVGGQDQAAAPGGAPVGGKSAAGASVRAPALPGSVVNAPGGNAAAAKTLLTTQALIQTADLSVEIVHGPDVATQADAADRIAIEAGGQVYGDERSGGAKPSATLTLKVPGAALGHVIDQLKALGKEVSRHSGTQDVTSEVADVDSRVRSAQASIARLRLLFDRATRIGDVIALESELSQREADLESLQAQQRAYAAQTSMATLTFHLDTAAAAAARAHQAAHGFVGGLERGWRAFTASAGAVATVFGAVVPFLVLALLLTPLAVYLRRRLRGVRIPVPAPPDPA